MSRQKRKEENEPIWKCQYGNGSGSSPHKLYPFLSVFDAALICTKSSTTCTLNNASIDWMQKVERRRGEWKRKRASSKEYWEGKEY